MIISNTRLHLAGQGDEGGRGERAVGVDAAPGVAQAVLAAGLCRQDTGVYRGRDRGVLLTRAVVTAAAVVVRTRQRGAAVQQDLSTVVLSAAEIGNTTSNAIFSPKVNHSPTSK